MKKIQRLAASTAVGLVLAGGISAPALAQSDTEQRDLSADSVAQPQLINDSFCEVFGRFFRNC